MSSDHVSEFEDKVGSPSDLWTALKERIQQENIKRFSEVADDLLGLLWCLDQYKIHGVAPRGMGRNLSGAYRMKGNWFADLISLLLVNQTASPLAPRSNIQGFSQAHQIDIAWPFQQQAPLVCVETKVMGGPPVGSTTARAATADWTKRRKELKFQATDLKLLRRKAATHIDHWGNWRRTAPPSVYFLWCARMKPDADRLDMMVREVRALNETYLDGAGIFAYRATRNGTAYETVSIPPADQVFDLDDLVHRIANQINDLAASSIASESDVTATPELDVAELEPDAAEPDE